MSDDACLTSLAQVALETQNEQLIAEIERQLLCVIRVARAVMRSQPCATVPAYPQPTSDLTLFFLEASLCWTCVDRCHEVPLHIVISLSGTQSCCEHCACIVTALLCRYEMVVQDMQQKLAQKVCHSPPSLSELQSSARVQPGSADCVSLAGAGACGAAGSGLPRRPSQ